MSVDIKDVDRGYSKLLRNVRFLKEHTIGVGVFEPQASQTYDSGITVRENALVHEFGSQSRGIPERSFLRSYADEQKPTFARQARRELERGFKKGGLMLALRRLALSLEGGVKRKITGFLPPPLSRKYADRKGSTNTLVDTGRLRASIKGRVTRRGP